MGESKHTPARWQSQGWVPTWTYIPVHDERHNVVCSVYPHLQRGVSYDEAADRARLIAAAPDLLAALETARVVVAFEADARGDVDGDYDQPASRALEEIDAAIAKAKGGAA